MVRNARFLVLAAIPATCALLSVRDATACGGLYAEPHITPIAIPRKHDVPRVKEQKVLPKTDSTLLVFDEAREIEHLVKEIRFDRTSKNVAFLVPVPSKATVAAVERSPFVALSGIAPSTTATVDVAPLEPGNVTVQKVGSFVVTHLDAKDAAKVEAWMKENGLEDTPSHREWRERHAAANFHFAAFHYAAQGDEWTLGMTNETVRLTFATKVPYLPYREVGDAPSLGEERESDLYVVSPHARKPVAGHMAWSGEVTIAQTHLERASTQTDAAALASTFGNLASLLPKGPLVMQTFRDRKPDRKGWGDVLLAPIDAGPHVQGGGTLFTGDPFAREATSIDPAWAVEHMRFARVLDPRIESATAPASTPPALATPGNATTSVGLGFIGLAVVASTLLRRRGKHARGLVSFVIASSSLLLVGCAMQGGQESTGVVAAPNKALQLDDKGKRALAVLDGHHHGVELQASEPFVREAYHQALRARFGQVTKCYEPYALRERGTVEVFLRVDTHGNVVASRLEGGTVENAKLAACVANELALAKFPTSSEMVNLRYAVDLGIESVWTTEYGYGPKKPPLPLAFQSY